MPGTVAGALSTLTDVCRRVLSHKTWLMLILDDTCHPPPPLPLPCHTHIPLLFIWPWAWRNYAFSKHICHCAERSARPFLAELVDALSSCLHNCECLSNLNSWGREWALKQVWEVEGRVVGKWWRFLSRLFFQRGWQCWTWRRRRKGPLGFMIIFMCDMAVLAFPLALSLCLSPRSLPPCGRSPNNPTGVLTGELPASRFLHWPPPPYIPVSISLMGAELLYFINFAPSEGKPVCVSIS